MPDDTSPFESNNCIGIQSRWKILSQLFMRRKSFIFLANEHRYNLQNSQYFTAHIACFISLANQNNLHFTLSGMFGLGQSQTRCIKGYSTAPIPDVTRLNPMRLAKLIWINNRTVTLMLADGSETRFNV